VEQYSQLKQLLIDSFNQFVQTFTAYIPNLVAAIALLLLGFILAWIAKWIILRLSAGIEKLLRAIGFASLKVKLKFPPGYYLGWLVFWLIILFFLRASIKSLGLPTIAEMLDRFLINLPVLLLAALIIFGGVILGNTVRYKIITSVDSVGLKRSDVLGDWIRIIIIVLATIFAFSQVGLDVDLFESLLSIAIATLLGSLALAFGLGAGPTVSNIISARYVRKNYHVGQKIRINEIEGTILELTSTGVILDTQTGRTLIPAKVFDEKASILFDDEIVDDS